MTDHIDLPVVATGDWIDAAWINQYLGDNLKAIFQGVAAGGDIPYAVDANTVGALHIGAAGGILTSSGSVPQWTTIGAANTFLRSSGTAPIWRALIHGRQGGSATVWSTPGTTAYTPSGSIIQMGAQNITISSGGTASVAITYPTAYTERPLIFLSANMSGSLSYTWSLGWSDDTTTGFYLHLKFASTTQIGTYTVAWMAVGI